MSKFQTAKPVFSPLRLAFVGVGARANAYAKDFLNKTEQVKIIAVADPDPLRRNDLADTHGIAPNMRFESYY